MHWPKKRLRLYKNFVGACEDWITRNEQDTFFHRFNHHQQRFKSLLYKDNFIKTLYSLTFLDRQINYFIPVFGKRVE